MWCKKFSSKILVSEKELGDIKFKDYKSIDINKK